MLSGCHHRSHLNRRKTAQLRELLASWHPSNTDATRRRANVLTHLDNVLGAFPDQALLDITMPLLTIRDRS
jgi:hypothetical protein